MVGDLRIALEHDVESKPGNKQTGKKEKAPKQTGKKQKAPKQTGNKEKTKISTSIISNQWVQVLSGINENTVLITENVAENNIKTSEAGSQMK